MPERALRLNGPSLEIVERCDGKHTVQQIVAELQQLYSKAEPAKVEQDILGYLALLARSARPRFRGRERIVCRGGGFAAALSLDRRHSTDLT